MLRRVRSQKALESIYRMIVIPLIKKIFALFIMMFMGWGLVKLKLIKSEDSTVVSTLILYLISPCMILYAFQIEFTPEVRDGLLLAFVAALVLSVASLAIGHFLRKALKLDAVEYTSVLYSNAGNLIIPIVISLLGEEWVVYTSAYICVQTFFLFSHGKNMICNAKGLGIKQVLTNINMIAIFAGIILLVSGIELPYSVADAAQSVGMMLGPGSMLVTGMLMANIEFKSLFTNKRIALVTALRLIAYPLLLLAIIKVIGLQGMAANGEKVLLITLLAASAPSASFVVQMAQVYGNDGEYASAINVVTILMCIITMPLMVFIYQSFI